MSAQPTVIRGGRVIRPDGVASGDIVIRDGVLADAPGPAGARVVDAAGCYVLPGFVDIHVHGGVGFDLTSGRFDPRLRSFDGRDEVYAEMLPRLAVHFARHGATHVLLATIASPEDRQERVLGLLADYVLSSRNGADGARLDGAFIEGTWTRDPAFSGAQNPEHFREPSIELFERFQAASRGIVRYAMIAPEWGESATRLIRHLHERGVLVGTGHTNCTADQYREAVRHGLRAAVHLTNGPTGGSFKPFAGGGALEAALTLPDVYAEQIVDGYHVNPAYVLDIIKRKGPDRVCLVTDAMFAAAAEGIADFEVAGIRGQLSPNGKYLSVVGKRNTLFGSVLTMDVGFQNVLNWLTADSPGIWNAVHPAMRFEDALPRVSGFASANPARALRLYDAHDGPAGRPRGQCIGSLEPGKRADVVVARIAGEQGRYEVALRHVFVGGRETVRA